MARPRLYKSLRSQIHLRWSLSFPGALNRLNNTGPRPTAPGFGGTIDQPVVETVFSLMPGTSIRHSEGVVVHPTSTTEPSPMRKREVHSDK